MNIDRYNYRDRHTDRQMDIIIIEIEHSKTTAICTVGHSEEGKINILEEIVPDGQSNRSEK